MELLTEEGVEKGRCVAASDHDTDTCIIHAYQCFVIHLTVVLEEVVESGAAQTNNGADHVNEKGH